jgi:hypothetical protein
LRPFDTFLAEFSGPATFISPEGILVNILSDISALRRRGVNPLENPVIVFMIEAALKMSGQPKLSKTDFRNVAHRGDRRVAFAVLKRANLLED